LRLISKRAETEWVCFDDLGIRKELQLIPKKTIKELERLNSFQTPVSKLMFISSLFDLFTREVESHHRKLKKKRGKEKKTLFSLLEDIDSKNSTDEGITITTDDLIPCFALILSRSRIKHLNANLDYIENFQELFPMANYGKSLNSSRLNFYFSTLKVSYETAREEVSKRVDKDELKARLKAKIDDSTFLRPRASPDKRPKASIDLPDDDLIQDDLSLSKNANSSEFDFFDDDRSQNESLNSSSGAGSLKITQFPHQLVSIPSSEEKSSKAAVPDLGDFLNSLQNTRDGHTGKLY
jgi:hypothetical protein